jgi:hypothetical protein
VARATHHVLAGKGVCGAARVFWVTQFGVAQGTAVQWGVVVVMHAYQLALIESSSCKTAPNINLVVLLLLLLLCLLRTGP